MDKKEGAKTKLYFKMKRFIQNFRKFLIELRSVKETEGRRFVRVEDINAYETDSLFV